MSDNDHDNFAVGDDVMFVPAGSYGERRGTVRKVTPSRVTVVSRDDEISVLHRSKWGPPYRCRRVTESDRARDEWQSATRTWEDAMPRTRHLFLSQWNRGGSYRLRLMESVDATLDALELIADEANLIREWLRKRPEEPRS